MKYVRDEITTFIRASDILLHSGTVKTPLTETEKGLMEAYVLRLWEELKLSVQPPFNWDQSPDQRHHKASA